MSSTEQIRWCAACRTESAFQMPPCDDGHGADCPDLACVVCGHAVVIGVLLVDDVVLVQAAA